MRRLLSVALSAAALAAPAAAHAAWGPAAPVGPPGRLTSVQGLAAGADDRPAALVERRRPGRGWSLDVRRARTATGDFGPATTVAASRAGIVGAGLFAGPRRELIAGWLEIINGSRRPVVATGPALADRQVLAPGPRSTQYMALAADARGDAVAAFWRYEGTRYAVWASYRRAGGRFSAARMLLAGEVSNPTVAIDGDGRALVVVSGPAGVQVSEHVPGAGAFSAPQALPGAGQPIDPATVAIAGGRAVIAWVARDADDRPDRVMVAERAQAGAPFAEPVAVSDAGVTLRGRSPAVAFDGGRAIVAWVQGTPGTVAPDRAALATSGRPGSWQRPQTRGVPAPARVVLVRMLGAAHGRRPLLTMTTQRPRSRFATLTASLRASGTLGPTGHPAPLSDAADAFTYAAQGSAHTYLLGLRPIGSEGVQQPLLLSSTP